MYQNGEFRFFCEVKGVAEDKWLDGLLTGAKPEEIVGGQRNDPVFNRIAKDIYDAVRQFDSVNPDIQHPNVLIFVNEKGSFCNYGDLLSTHTGYFFAESGTKDYIYGKYSDGRIRTMKQRINLFVWLEPSGKQYYLFNDVEGAHVRNLCSWFGKDPDNIKRLGS